jgi:bifunctional DNA-binding transcriptional regulator/antitoxin component of YhaV-PrlF toxin-antitoxin module
VPTRHTVTVTSVGSSSVIVLPKPVVDGFNLKKGDRLEMTVTDKLLWDTWLAFDYHFLISRLII